VSESDRRGGSKTARWEIRVSLTRPARDAAHIDTRTVHGLIRAVLQLEDAPPLALSLTFVGDEEMRRINAAYLGRDCPTDVVSFEMPPAGDGDAPAVGDVYVSIDRARAQAAERRRPFEDELRLLVVHGVLHALGYDDEAAGPRRLMRARERAALRSAAHIAPLVRSRHVA
jgi:probable rRNA maturation factor